MKTIPMTRRSLVTGLAASALLTHSRPVRAQTLPKIVVSKDPTCGCCTGWLNRPHNASAQVLR
ncbi:DUF411 domain-containing protein [Microvirga arsenatis]|uniref:Uncharacterized protein n=1 Tax=Microvirga arsenatis TaxID=2692265 RepID=A0ABW9Z801_9HYPH|nr:hypothetical protein [Microvirga arsenatis]NBJ13012.1 hypothetical protein [Microvirga arsenatis]NBJ26764.1 hypothetical protein [Microvirga arsenatis]